MNINNTLNILVIDKFKFTLLVIFISCLIVNFNKPLQMDELSTYFHCSDKTFIEFIDTNKTGVNMLPSFYFLINWSISLFLI